MSNDDRDYVYTTKAWRQFRARMLKELDHVCVVCNKDLFGNDITLDHILPVSLYPDLMLEPTNIQVMCRYHNSMKQDSINARSDYFNTRWINQR